MYYDGGSYENSRPQKKNLTQAKTSKSTSHCLLGQLLVSIVTTSTTFAIGIGTGIVMMMKVMPMNSRVLTFLCLIYVRPALLILSSHSISSTNDNWCCIHGLFIYIRKVFSIADRQTDRQTNKPSHHSYLEPVPRSSCRDIYIPLPYWRRLRSCYQQCL